jgi:NAD(P)-dependent dehydrogenase (short-subunit alcohol dehydrogenase family)
VSRVAVVTGGASGIGLSTVAMLIEAGWAVGVIDINAAALAEADIAFAGEEIMLIDCDVTDEDAVGEAFDMILERFGLISTLVNCAGVGLGTLAEETSVEDFRRIVDVNLTGSFITCKAAMERMGASLAIVNISSCSGLRANAGRVAYGAAKAGVKMMTEILALETAERRIRVNAIAPGPIDTPFVQALHTPQDRVRWRERTPMDRYGAPEDIARAIMFLVSDDAGYITGHTLSVDGGFAIAGIMPER